MKIRCPFLNAFSGPDTDIADCVYMDLADCDDIEINPGNGDAWCHTMIYEGIKKTEDKKEQLKKCFKCTQDMLGI